MNTARALVHRAASVKKKKTKIVYLTIYQHGDWEKIRRCQNLKKNEKNPRWILSRDVHGNRKRILPRSPATTPSFKSFNRLENRVRRGCDNNTARRDRCTTTRSTHPRRRREHAELPSGKRCPVVERDTDDGARGVPRHGRDAFVAIKRE